MADLAKWAPTPAARRQSGRGGGCRPGSGVECPPAFVGIPAKLVLAAGPGDPEEPASGRVKVRAVLPGFSPGLEEYILEELLGKAPPAYKPNQEAENDWCQAVEEGAEGFVVSGGNEIQEDYMWIRVLQKNLRCLRIFEGSWCLCKSRAGGGGRCGHRSCNLPRFAA